MIRPGIKKQNVARAQQAEDRRWRKRIASLRRKTKRSLKCWTSEMKRAERDLCSGDERNAREQVLWLKGYLKALDDVEQP